MAVLKCKMCGGDLNITADKKIIECEFCGTTQTIPDGSDEKKTNLFNRANRLRIANEFDKAAGIYESIIAEFPDEAESYWGLCLCKFGIEYVDDPKTAKKIPTCHRTSFESIFDDENYKMALEKSDVIAQGVYKEEATVIDNLQKDILSIVHKEEPFDVFICYKETDELGQRTQDSVLAQDIYDALTDKGFKVFFSRITLEDKLGKQYEPYIFAALNSAKVMVAIGTKLEHFKAVWVKNEWSRYLSLIKTGANKILIPAYRDMDPYDLPEEFKHLQAQDMSKLGFMQDLVRGIKKIVSIDAPSEAKETVVVQSAVSGNSSALIKRGFLALEDGEWAKADEFFEQALNQNAEDAQAYLGKLMAELNVSKQKNLKNCKQPFDDKSNYQKAIRFGNDSLKNELNGYIEFINIRNENDRLNKIYISAVNGMKMAQSEEYFKSLAEEFSLISGYKDSKELSDKCRELAECVRKDEILKDVESLFGTRKWVGKEADVKPYEQAIYKLKEISGYKNADELITTCENKIEEIKAKLEEERLEKERKEELEKKETERIAKRNKKIAIIVTPIVVLTIIAIVLINAVIIPSNKYKKAVTLINEGKINEAVLLFEEIKGYKDSATQIKEATYNKAIELMSETKYDNAIETFELIKEYKDSEEKLLECDSLKMQTRYNEAVNLMQSGDIIRAYELFSALNGYGDSLDKVNSLYEKYSAKKIQNSTVGSCVPFGKYEQDNDEANGKENIEWVVLAKENKKILVISKYILETRLYDNSHNAVTWEKSTLRKWLNNEFLNTAFTVNERVKIPTTLVPADKNPEYSTYPGNATRDKVFLLSVTEAEKYLSAGERECETTNYVKGHDPFGTADIYWLRTPGNQGHYASGIYPGGSIDEFGTLTNDFRGVRPVMWISLNEN